MSTTTANRVSKAVITPQHPDYAHLDSLCLNARYLYNAMNYDMRQEFFDKEKTVSHWQAIKKRYAKENRVEYRALPAKISRDVAKRLGEDWNSYWKLRKNNKKKARIPGYHHGASRRTVDVSNDALTRGKKGFENNLTFNGMPTSTIPLPRKRSAIKSVRLVPRGRNIIVEFAYSTQVLDISEEEKRHRILEGKLAGLDLGIDNFATVSIDDERAKPLIINGGKFKSVNQWANKQSAYLHSKLGRTPEGKKIRSSRRIDAVWAKRNNTVEGMIHCVTSVIVDYLQLFRVECLIVGWNENFKSSKKSKNNPGMGRRNNQNFRGLPHRRFLEVLKYKLADAGIAYQETEESYTSKTSVLSGELPYKQRYYAARRVYRGLLVDGRRNLCINADVNGAAQIVRKCNPKAFSWAEGLAGEVSGLLSPVKVSAAGGHPVASDDMFLVAPRT